MPLPVIPLALGLAQLAPTIFKWLDKPDAAAIAEKVVGVAQGLTGRAEPQEAVDALLADPAARLKFIDAWREIELGLYEAETRRLEAVNDQMGREVVSGDPVVRRARPAFLWAMAITWSVQGVGFTIAALKATFTADPALSAAIFAGIAQTIEALAPHWLYAMAATGVAVYARQRDKNEGTPPGGMLGRFSGLLRGGK